MAPGRAQAAVRGSCSINLMMTTTTTTSTKVMLMMICGSLQVRPHTIMRKILQRDSSEPGAHQSGGHQTCASAHRISGRPSGQGMQGTLA